MKPLTLLPAFAAVLLAAAPMTVSAQNAIKLFGPVDVRQSAQGTGYGANAVIFNTTILNLTCAAPITAKISSTPDGNGNVLVDNFITLSTGGTPVNICTQGLVDNGNEQDCFTSGYTALASPGGLIGQDPDTYTSIGGVPAIDVSSMLSPGQVQATIGLVDTAYGPSGFDLTSSTLYLVTSCTQNGVAGPGKVTGNPISSNNPTPQQVTQNYPFKLKPKSTGPVHIRSIAISASRQPDHPGRHSALLLRHPARSVYFSEHLPAGHFLCHRKLPAAHRRTL